MKEIWQQAKQKISAGDLSSALALLVTHCSGEQEIQVITYQSELSRLAQQSRMFGKNTDVEESELTHRVLQFILQQEISSTAEKQISAKSPWQEKRRKSIEQQLEQTNELLSQWEETHRLTSHPTEAARAKKEITRLNQLVEEYLAELARL